MVLRSPALIALLAACGAKAAPTPVQGSGGTPPVSCAEVAAHIADVSPKLHDDARRRFIDMVATRCRDDGWSDDTRACFHRVGIDDDAGRCAAMFTPRQLDALGAANRDFERDLRAAEATSSAPISPTVPSLVLVIDAAGAVTIAGRSFTDDQLDALFAAAVQRDPNTQVILRADTNAAHGRVVELMEHAKKAGLHRLAIGTAP